MNATIKIAWVEKFEEIALNYISLLSDNQQITINMNTLIVVAFAILVATATASIHGLGYGHVGVINPYALSPVGPSGVVTGHGAHGPSGTVTGAGAVGPSGIVTGAGPIGPTGPAGHGHGVVVAAPVLGLAAGHELLGLGGHGLGLAAHGVHGW